MPAETSSDPTPPRVLLVDPYVARDDPMERKFVELYPSLGILTLAGYLRQHAVEVSVVDLTFARDTRPVAAELRRFHPDLFGVHTKTLTLDRALAVARLARNAGAYTVAGGPDAATRPATYLAEAFDAVALGEGEATLLELARAVHDGHAPSGIAGLAVLEGDRVVRGPARPFLSSLDDLPLPAWETIDLERYLSSWKRASGERRMAVLTSRGCPFDCAWCSKPTFGRSYRQQSVGRVLDEIRALKERYGVDYIRFCDDVFGIQRAWLEELLGRMIDERLDVQFECLARVDLLKPDLLEKMRKAGLARVYVGVESGSQRMLDAMNRGTKLAQVERAAEALRKEGIRQYWFLMLGYPGETLEDITETLRLFRRFSPEEYSVSIAVPVPGTRFYDAVKDRLRRSSTKSRASSGGRALLYEAVYPESLYRWAQARFDFEASLSKAKGKIAPPVLKGLEDAADALDRRVVTPILLGGNSEPPAA